MAAVALFKQSSAAVPPEPEEISDVDSGFFIIKERGVRVAISYDATIHDSSVLETRFGELQVLAAWPKDWQRKPLIVVVLGGELIDLGAGAAYSWPLQHCEPSEAFEDGDSCTSARPGTSLEVPTVRGLPRDELEIPLRAFQLILEPNELEPDLVGSDLLRSANDNLAEILGATSDQWIGGATLPFSPVATVERDGSLARLTLPALDTGGNFYDSVCLMIDCDEQRQTLAGSGLIEEGHELEALSLANVPTGETDSAISDINGGYLGAQLLDDWSPIGTGSPRVMDWPQLVWAVSTVASTYEKNALSVVMESPTAASQERSFGFAAGGCLGVATGLFLVAVEAVVGGRLRRRTIVSSR